ncbi:MAG: hypothetical protein JW384_00699 [Nitrosomonadaceae bacterium]|nr:hypothetical protein [Nitrosomonadaceae bacterium]
MWLGTELTGLVAIYSGSHCPNGPHIWPERGRGWSQGRMSRVMSSALATVGNENRWAESRPGVSVLNAVMASIGF